MDAHAVDIAAGSLLAMSSPRPYLNACPAGSVEGARGGPFPLPRLDGDLAAGPLHFVGILARWAGDPDDAVELLTAALARGELAEFVPFARRAAHEPARTLRLRGRTGDEVAATALDGRAARLAAALQMPPPTA